MDLEMVLNELSLQPLADDIPAAKQRMSELISTMSAATKAGVSRVLRTHKDLNADELAHNYPLARWRNDRDVDQVARSYFRSLATKAPYLTDISDVTITDKVDGSDFFYEGKNATGLGIAYILDALALSLRSESRWFPAHLEINYTSLDIDGEILEEPVSVMHASHRDHILITHAHWIRDRLSTKIGNGSDIWKQRERLFPSLQFCESVGEKLQSLNSGNPQFHLVAKKLYELEKFCQQWQESGGAFKLENMPLRGSVESEATLTTYKQEHTFLCPDGEDRVFSLHIRITLSWRLHYYPVSDKQQLIIGYIGEHLPTKNYT